MIRLVNHTRRALPRGVCGQFKKIMLEAGAGGFEVEVAIFNAQNLRRLNFEFLGKNYATDVLSFGLEGANLTNPLNLSQPENPLNPTNPTQPPNPAHPLNPANPRAPRNLGSIAISLDAALAAAKKHRHALKTELSILFTHALLHLLGFDHEKDRGEHRQREAEILARFGIERPLIARSEGGYTPEKMPR